MTEERFWQIISAAQGEAEAVTAALGALSAQEIEAWDRIYWEKHNALHRWDVWEAADIIAGGCGDDSFHYFKAFAIGKGESFYEALRADPDSVGPMLTEDDEDNGFDNELLNYAAIEAYEAVAPGKELDALSNEGSEPAGERIPEEEAPAKFPRLWAQFGE